MGFSETSLPSSPMSAAPPFKLGKDRNEVGQAMSLPVAISLMKIFDGRKA